MSRCCFTWTLLLKAAGLMAQLDTSQYYDGLPVYSDTTGTTKKLPADNIFEWFSQGEIEFINGGMLRSCTKVAEISIGEPDKVSVLMYLMAGATTQPVSDKYGINALCISDILNGYGGKYSIGFHGSKKFSQLSKNTFVSATYQAAIRSLTGTSVETEKNIPMYSGYYSAGLRLDTKAWKHGTKGEVSETWVKTFLGYAGNDEEKMKTVFGEDLMQHNMITGNFECGIFIKDYAAITFSVHRFLNNRKTEVFSHPYYMFSADISMSGN
ncbi:MAG: hypothetical protein IPF52_14520 [Saprospiraceae bacterium]|nr:hypothetical protein [Saprospiraceae bacterium]